MAEEQQQAEGFTPITSQEQLNSVIGERIRRAEAKAAERFADYEELRAKAARLDEQDEAAKSDLEKATERAARAEAKLKAFEQEKKQAEWRAQVSKDTGVPAEVLRGSTLDELKAHAEALAPLMRKTAGVVPGDGLHAEGAPAESASEWFRQKALDSMRRR